MLRAKNKLGIVFFPAFDWAISPTHPERQERLLYTQDQIFEEGIDDIEGISFFNPRIATKKDIARVHFVVPTVDSVMTESHYIAAGGAIAAMDAVMNKTVDKAFSLTRPPGHHAMRVVYGDRGFCVANIEAVMIEHIRAIHGNLRVAIIDTDAHHGDGTQDIYWNDKETLFISFHQDGRTLYPGTGFIDELGGPSAYGYNINIPLPPNTGDAGFEYILEHVVMPILDEYKPDLIINSAGQDNHYSDPLTNMNFSARGYAKLNERLSPDVAVLEGGYSIEGALPYINVGIILAMAGLDYSNVIEPDFAPHKISQTNTVTKQIENIANEVYKRWSNKKALSSAKFGNKQYVTEDRQIYYDTSNIMEHQKVKYKRCKSCSGVSVIHSTSDKGDHIKAITIPIDACSTCQNEGFEIYNNAKSANYTNIYLQDRVNDEYKSS